MITTIETRLWLDESQTSLLDACMQTWSQAYRQTWSYYNRQQLSEKDIYQKLSQTTNFTSHQIGSLIHKVKAEHMKLKGLTKQQLKQTHAKIDQVQTFILKQHKNLTSPKSSAAKIQAAKLLTIQKNKKLNRLYRSSKVLQKRIDTNTFKLCFGSSTLFKQQPDHFTKRFRLSPQQKAYTSQEEWRTDWVLSRQNIILSVGHQTAFFGNKELQYNPETQELRVRVTENVYRQRLQEKASAMGLRFKDLNDHKILKHGPIRKEMRTFTIQKVLFADNRLAKYQQVLSNKKPVTAKIIKKQTSKGEVGYYLQLSFDEVVVALKNPTHLTLGCDLNEKGLAYCIVKDDGNKLNSKDKGFGFLSWDLRHKSSQQRQWIISNKISQLLKIAQEYGVNTIAIENLDFSQTTSQMNAGYRNQADFNRTISQFAKSQFKELLTRKARRLGITIQLVNPAYSSVGGYVKYGLTNKLPVDIAASLWLARQGLYGEEYKQENNLVYIKKHHEAVVLPYHFQAKQSKSLNQGRNWKAIASALGRDRRKWYQSALSEFRPKVGSILSSKKKNPKLNPLGLVMEQVQEHYPPERQTSSLLTPSTR